MAEDKYLNIITGHSHGLGAQLAGMLDPNNTVGISRTLRHGVPYKQVQWDLSGSIDFSSSCWGCFEGNKINLILNAGTLGGKGGIKDGWIDDWEKTMRINLFGNLKILKAFLPVMIKEGYGRVVFLSGGGAAYAFPEFSGYALSKVGVVRSVENIGVELKELEDFSIIALAPGAMETDMLKQVREAGVEVKSVADIADTAQFIKSFIEMPKEKAKPLSGKFIHAKDDLNSDGTENKWVLRRIE